MTLKQHFRSSVCLCTCVGFLSLLVQAFLRTLQGRTPEHPCLSCREDVVEVNARMVLVFVASLMVHAAARESAAQPVPRGVAG